MRPRKSGESAYAPIPPIADRIPYFIAPETAPETAARAAGSACDICTGVFWLSPGGEGGVSIGTY